MEESKDDSTTIKRHHLEELRFYGFAGICIIRFQQLDDYLSKVFAKLLDIPPGQADLVFGAIRTVSRRCSVIAALIDQTCPTSSGQWRSLVTRISQAENNRNSIAHGSPVYGGGTTTLIFDRDLESLLVSNQTESFYYLEKPGFRNWTTDMLLAEAKETQALLSDVYAFTRELPDRV